jgi:hypothetical protein
MAEQHSVIQLEKVCPFGCAREQPTAGQPSELLA